MVLRRPHWGWLVVMLPLPWLLWQGSQAINPVESIIRDTGLWGLRLLLASLSISPLRRFFTAPFLLPWRRILGLGGFFYACLHLLLYVGLEQSFNPISTLDDILQRPFISIGMLAWLLLLPLALTSSRTRMRQLGRRWGQLHRLVYLINPLVVLHFFWMVKSNWHEVAIYTSITTLLLSSRIWHKFGQK